MSNIGEKKKKNGKRYFNFRKKRINSHALRSYLRRGKMGALLEAAMSGEKRSSLENASEDRMTLPRILSGEFAVQKRPGRGLKFFLLLPYTPWP